jgi:hypothetical protein
MASRDAALGVTVEMCKIYPLAKRWWLTPRRQKSRYSRSKKFVNE